jgi:ABC-type glycerol-3-phosphate transport system substrate-binding protein
MKRIFVLLLVSAMVLGLTGCGDKAAELSASTASAQEPVTVQAVGGYVVPSAWVEDSINDGTWGYVTEAAPDLRPSNLPGGAYLFGGYYFLSNALELTWYDAEGNVLGQLSSPSLLTEPVAEGSSESLGYFCVGQQDIWLLHECYVSEASGSDSYLEHWDQSGNQLLCLPLDQIGIQDENFLNGMTLSPDGLPLLFSMNAIYFLDETGAVTAAIDTAGGWYDYARDQDDRLYIIAEDQQVYTVDWTNHALGLPLLNKDYSDKLLPGGGDYDFLMSNSSTLQGVSLETGTITELLSWDDWDLAGLVQNVTITDDLSFRVTVQNSFGSSYDLLLRRVPAEEVPEKELVTLAVGLSADSDWAWTDVLPQELNTAISQFNQNNSDCRLEVVTFSSSQDLQTKLLSGEAPDLIYWGNTLDDAPSAQIYAKKGYLADLEPLFAADAELSLEDFFPSIISLTRQTYGGIYALPQFFYFRSLMGQKALVEHVETFSDLLAVAQTMPEDMMISDSTQLGALHNFLGAALNTFVDVPNGTCDFETQEFYDLLTLCRDYFPQEPIDPDEAEETEYLFDTYAGLGHVFQFVSEVVRPMEGNGTTFVGYPDTGSNGLNLVLSDPISICSLGAHQDAAWQFLRTLYDADFQGSTDLELPVRLDVFQETEEYWISQHPEDCTEAELQQVIELLSQADSMTIYDSPALDIVDEEVQAFFSGDKSAEEVAALIQNRVEIYLGEQQ